MHEEQKRAGARLPASTSNNPPSKNTRLQAQNRAARPGVGGPNSRQQKTPQLAHKKMEDEVPGEVLAAIYHEELDEQEAEQYQHRENELVNQPLHSAPNAMNRGGHGLRNSPGMNREYPIQPIVDHPMEEQEEFREEW